MRERERKTERERDRKKRGSETLRENVKGKIEIKEK